MSTHSLAHRAMRHPSFVLGSVLLCLVACAALLSLAWTPYALTDIDMTYLRGLYHMAPGGTYLGERASIAYVMKKELGGY